MSIPKAKLKNTYISAISKGFFYCRLAQTGYIILDKLIH